MGARFGGRKKGTPNRATADVRAAIAHIAEAKVSEVEGWLDRVAKRDPGRACDLYLRLIEYHIPKLSRAELAGVRDQPITVVINDPTRRAASA